MNINKLQEMTTQHSLFCWLELNLQPFLYRKKGNLIVIDLTSLTNEVGVVATITFYIGGGFLAYIKADREERKADKEADMMRDEKMLEVNSKLLIANTQLTDTNKQLVETNRQLASHIEAATKDIKENQIRMEIKIDKISDKIEKVGN